LFAANPAVTSNSLLFTEMIGEGYTVGGLRTGSSLSSPLPDSPVLDVPRMGGDWFHPTAPDPTASEMSDSAWAERATRDGSRVVRFLTADLGHDAVSVTDEAENAEEPAVSPDGQVLAFLRAERGRNSLWIRTVGVDIDKPAEAAARQVLGTEYDVRDASFATGHRIIFSSNRTGQFALYVVGLSGDVQQLLRPTCSARYPAMSPDGRWVAFSCEQGGSWQLHAMDLQTNQDLRLSTGDCNSISPVWTPDSRRLIYATDCGRGLGLTALAEVTVLH
jgi:dipeptidyl aminopeptidase/acylaminoacyl peptidase